LLALAVAVSFIWALTLALLVIGDALTSGAVVMLDATHIFFWILCVRSMLEGFASGRRLLLAAGAAGGWAVIVSLPLAHSLALAWTAEPAVLGMTVIGLLVAEQVLRNGREEQQRHLRLLCLATGGIFVV